MVLGPGMFIVEQILVFHPVISLVWLVGLWFFLLGRGTKYRILGWIYLTLLIVFIALHGKDYYLVTLIAAAGLHVAPAVLPLLSPQNQVAYRLNDLQFGAESR